MDDILVILNPAARSERARNVWDRIESLPRAQVRPTQAPGDAERYAREAAETGVRIVVAAGGDGTINGVVNGLAGSDTALGILPVGTMNVFAAEMGLPNDLEEAWEIIEAGYTRSIDLAQANEHFFVQLAGLDSMRRWSSGRAGTSKRTLARSVIWSVLHRLRRKSLQRLSLSTRERSVRARLS
jgi:diacylglycerol kinase family enzyme